MLVTVEQAKAQVHEIGNAEDSVIETMIKGASTTILAYLKTDGDEWLDSNLLPVDVPADIQTATLVYVGWLFRNRDEDPDKAFQLGTLPYFVSVHIYWRRQLTLA